MSDDPEEEGWEGTLHGALDDSGAEILGERLTCDPSTLAPDESVVCTADGPYVVTAADAPAPAQRVSNQRSGSTHHHDSDPCDDCTLPDTGAPAGLWWWVTGGVLLVVTGVVLRIRGARGHTIRRVRP